MNKEFSAKNDISSIHAVADRMGKSDCFICDLDLFLSDPSLLDVCLQRSCGFGKMVPGHSDDWVYGLEDGRAVRIGEKGNDAYNIFRNRIQINRRGLSARIRKLPSGPARREEVEACKR